MQPPLRAIAVKLALSARGIPYIWGGAIPSIGFDCSGFIVWIFQIIGLLPKGDWTAQTLYSTFAHRKRVTSQLAGPGDLIFYGTDVAHIVHVMLKESELTVIGAHGAGRSCVTREDASRLGARVSTVMQNYRADIAAIICVTYPDEE
jgi:hypothetical protein